MSDPQQSEPTQAIHNPWKTGVIATAGALVILVAAGFAFAAFNSGTPSEAASSGDAANDTAAVAEQEVEAAVAATRAPEPVPAPAPVATPAPAAAPAPVVRENCTAYLNGATRDNKRIVKDGALGALVGAGTGAAGGAIADGGSGAGKGAGIGAVVGAVAGAFHGVTEENERAAQAERAYQACLARNSH